MHYYLILIVLFFVAIIAGIIDTLAGGGGLLVVPALLTFNLSPAMVLGTTKFQAVFGEFNASMHFFRRKQFSLKEISFGLLMLSIGATAGAILVQLIHPHILKKVIPFLLLAILLYTIFSPAPMNEKRKPKLSARWFYIFFGTGIGFYNGFFGPGTGSFLVVTIMVFLGLDIVKSVVVSKPLNFIANFVALLWFIFGGSVNYAIGFSMGAGQIIGSHIGARLVIHRGHKIIKPIYITVVAIMTVSLFVKYY